MKIDQLFIMLLSLINTGLHYGPKADSGWGTGFSLMGLAGATIIIGPADCGLNVND
ncbi:MAG: hypothetical protein V4560_05200 [Bacteroidota bacterium]|jgi:hypothetical protein